MDDRNDERTHFDTVIGEPAAKARLTIDPVEWPPKRSPLPPAAFMNGVANGQIPREYGQVVMRYLASIHRDMHPSRLQDVRTFLEALALDFRRRPRLEALGGLGTDGTRTRLVRAAIRLSDEWSGLLPASLWETYAYPARMRDPEERRSILEDANALPNAWWMHDILLHAPAKVYSFMLHVQSTFSEVAGVVLDHECGCSDCISPDDGRGPRLFVPAERRPIVAQAVFEHILAEAVLVICDRMPFVFATERALLEKAGAA